MFAFPTEHRVPSQGMMVYFCTYREYKRYDNNAICSGYAVIYSRKGGLFPQYANCEKEEIIELRKQKVRIYEQEDTVELVYSGDTTLHGLLNLPEKFNHFLSTSEFSTDGNQSAACHPVLHSVNLDFIFTADILLLEMTYLDGDVEKASSRGHIHLQDLITNGPMFQNK